MFYNSVCPKKKAWGGGEFLSVSQNPFHPMFYVLLRGIRVNLRVLHHSIPIEHD